MSPISTGLGAITGSARRRAVTTRNPAPEHLQTSERSDRTEPDRSDVEPRWPVAAELALAGVTTAAVLGLIRLFSDGSFILPVLIAAIFSHAVASLGRHFGFSPTLGGLVSALAVLVITAWVVEPGTTTFGLPLEGTWQALGEDLHTAWARFAEVRAPTAAIPGFVAAAACGAGLAAALSDGLAFRARARFEALAPSFTLFMFGALLGSDRHRLLAAALYFGAVLLFFVVSRPPSTQPWFHGRSSQGESALLRGGLAMGGVALLAAVALGPYLPGAESLGLVGLDDESPKGSSSRVTVSPLVDIRSRLVDQSDTEMFTVQTDTSSYWRLTALGRFDGNIWSSLGKYQPISGRLGSDGPSSPTTESIPQRFSISALSSIWLPAAYRPERFDGPEGIRYDADSSSLLTDAPSSDGLRYLVSSSQPRLTAEQLADTTPVTAPDITRRYLALPADFPDRVRSLAAQVTSQEALPYGKAKALQDWFRDSFTYDLNVPPGHDESAMERFLFVTRRGYCEQFAGSYAAMARSLGIPARVAVGFTAGDRQGDGTFRVAGKEAHAWPEVYMNGVGWVAFEPTPGRAIPSADAYTDVSPPPTEPPAGPDPTTPATTIPVPDQEPPPTQPPATEPAQPPAATSSDGGFPFWVLAVGAALLVIAAYVVGVPMMRRRLRSRRWESVNTPSDQVLVAWRHANEDLELAGIRKRPSETAQEFAGRLATESDQVGLAMTDLAGHWTTVAYSPAGVSSEAAAGAQAAAKVVEADLTSRASRWQRVLRQLDPRPLLRQRWA